MKTILISTAVALALALPASGSAGAARGASGSTTFADSTGELSGGPDITAVTVSNDDKGTLTFAIAVPNRPSLTQDMGVAVFLDTDLNASTGYAGGDGADYVIDYEGGTADLGKWNGSAWDWSTPQSSLVSSYSSGATLKLNVADLGGVSAFNFFVAVLEMQNGSPVIDFAPDAGHGTWNYRVAIAPPAAPPPAKQPPAKPKPTTPKCKKGQKSTKAHRCHK
jgi:hypothetical protein